jgi:hypothetical protein
MHFLKQVRVSDLVLPGRKIDVPVELLTAAKKCRCHEHETAQNEAKELVNL